MCARPSLWFYRFRKWIERIYFMRSVFTLSSDRIPLDTNASHNIIANISVVVPESLTLFNRIYYIRLFYTIKYYI